VPAAIPAAVPAPAVPGAAPAIPAGATAMPATTHAGPMAHPPPAIAAATSGLHRRGGELQEESEGQHGSETAKAGEEGQAWVFHGEHPCHCDGCGGGGGGGGGVVGAAKPGTWLPLAYMHWE